jgi:hypothetical protein
MDKHYDPAQSVVGINALAKELRELISPASNTDYNRILEVIADLRLHTGDVRSWALARSKK